ncbi:MAG: carboxypeptidase-like regulatory domain-containing protein [Ignavibacteriales bacterium]|nr:carboxypeptidase-like regulatory domain-containing protein [Ignavibacteriales bacterium]
MKHHALILACIFVLAAWDGCKDSGSILDDDSGIEGQVFLISKPGPIPIGWIPPPLEQVNTIQVLDAQRKIVREAATSDKGKFIIPVQPGTYYLRVKESPITAETGPFVIAAGRYLIVEAHYDSGMR